MLALVDAGYRVLNLDNRGHGQSGPHREPFTIWDMADDLIAVLDDSGVDEAARRLIASQVVSVLFGSTARRDQRDLVATWRDRFLAQDPASMMTVGHALVHRDDVTDRLAEIRVPTLVIVGDQDVDPGVAASVALAARIPGAQLVALPDTGHLAALERPDAFGAALRLFADAPPPPGT